MSIRNQYSNSDQNNAQKKTGRNTGLLALSPLVVFLSRARMLLGQAATHISQPLQTSFSTITLGMSHTCCSHGALT